VRGAVVARGLLDQPREVVVLHGDIHHLCFPRFRGHRQT